LKQYKLNIVILFVLVQIALANDNDFFQPRFHKEIPRKNEKELKIKISGGAGVFYILPGDKDKIAIIDGYSDKESGKNLVDINYFVEDGIGYLELEMTHLKSGKKSGDEKWYIKLCDDLPTSLDIELGATKADIDLGGLNLKNVKLSTGVSSTNLKFTKPNKTIMRRFEIEAGLAKFDGEKLGNARFRSLNFSGGMGTFDLDLSGELIDDADVNLSIGFGNLDVYLPKDVGAIIVSPSALFTSKKFDNFYKKGDKYISFNFNEVQKKINIFIESGLGNIKVRWID